MTAPPTETAVPLDKSNQRVQSMFGQIAPRYDLMNHLLSGGIDLYWRWYTVRKVPPQGNSPILDVCTGTGDLALAYWRKAEGQLSVVGTDFTPEMLTLAMRKRDAAKIPGGPLPEHVTEGTVPIPVATGSDPRGPLTFLEADTQHLPFASDQFQIVSVAFGLRNVCDTKAGVREMMRVCQPGGRVAILEFSQPRIPLLGTLYGLYFRHVLPRIGQFFASNRQSAYKYLPESVGEFPSGADLVTILTECGLENVSYHTLTLGVATLYLGKKPQ